MKTKIFIILFLLNISVHSFAQFSDEYFTVTSSSKQRWYGGCSWTHGTTFKFNICFLQNVRLHFDTIWINANHAIPVKNINNENKKFSEYLTDGKITINASDIYSGQPEIDEEKKLNSKCPVEFTGDAVIRFYIKKKAYYYIVDDMQELESIAYP